MSFLLKILFQFLVEFIRFWIGMSFYCAMSSRLSPFFFLPSWQDFIRLSCLIHYFSWGFSYTVPLSLKFFVWMMSLKVLLDDFPVLWMKPALIWCVSLCHKPALVSLAFFDAGTCSCHHILNTSALHLSIYLSHLLILSNSSLRLFLSMSLSFAWFSWGRFYFGLHGYSSLLLCHLIFYGAWPVDFSFQVC